MTLIQDLIRIADALDGAGLYSFADTVDELGKGPSEPYQIAIFRNLYEAFWTAAKDPNNPEITEENLPSIFKIIEETSSRWTEQLRPSRVAPTEISREAYGLAGTIADIIISMRELSGDPEQADDLRSEEKSLAQAYERLNKMREEDPVSYEQVVKRVDEILREQG